MQFWLVRLGTCLRNGASKAGGCGQYDQSRLHVRCSITDSAALRKCFGVERRNLSRVVPQILSAAAMIGKYQNTRHFGVAGQATGSRKR
jgi:hypothetical protein